MPTEPKRQDFKSQADYEKALDEYILADEEQGEQELDEFFKRKEAEQMPDVKLKMRCPSGKHDWIETYPTSHRLFGVCPGCPGAVLGKVLFIIDDERTDNPKEFVHQCITPGCGTLVQYDDEPCCYKHSPDSGSHLPFYSARERLTEGISPPQ